MELNLNLNNMVQITIIIGFAAGVIKLLIVNPLQSAINTLNDAVEKMENMLSRLEREQQGIDKRLVAVEESSKSAHHRIDGWEARQK